jgi:four helix bundle protein
LLVMATMRSFEELEVWKKARVISTEIFKATMSESFVKDFALKDQIKRASGSIMDNIAEGFERGGRKEFIQFLSYAEGSSGEVKSQLYRALDRQHVDEETFQKFHHQVSEIGKMLAGLINYLKKTTVEGTKYLKEPDSFYQALHFEFEEPTIN